MKLLLAKCFVGISCMLFIVGAYLIWERTNPDRLTLIPYTAPARLAGQPDTLTIPAAHISLPIYPAHLIGTHWDQTTRGVSYLVSSPLPGTQGNSVVYGHNWTNLLGPLNKVKPGDALFVKYGTNSMKFTVQFVGIVAANTMSIIAPTTDTRVTLYTCTGFLDSQRIVVTAIRDTPTTSAQSAYSSV